MIPGTYVLCTRYVCTWYQPAEIYTYVRGGTHDTYVPPVDAHVWRQLHLSAVARCSDSYCIFAIVGCDVSARRCLFVVVSSMGHKNLESRWVECCNFFFVCVPCDNVWTMQYMCRRHDEWASTFIPHRHLLKEENQENRFVVIYAWLEMLSGGGLSRCLTDEMQGGAFGSIRRDYLCVKQIGFVAMWFFYPS